MATPSRGASNKFQNHDYSIGEVYGTGKVGLDTRMIIEFSQEVRGALVEMANVAVKGAKGRVPISMVMCMSKTCTDPLVVLRYANVFLYMFSHRKAVPRPIYCDGLLPKRYLMRMQLPEGLRDGPAQTTLA